MDRARSSGTGVTVSALAEARLLTLSISGSRGLPVEPDMLRDRLTKAYLRQLNGEALPQADPSDLRFRVPLGSNRLWNGARRAEEPNITAGVVQMQQPRSWLAGGVLWPRISAVSLVLTSGKAGADRARLFERNALWTRPHARGIALRNFLTGESPVARFGHDRLYQSTCKTHLGRAPWINLLSAGRGWRTRGPAMPVCTISTNC
jgi:hypothetical protein